MKILTEAKTKEESYKAGYDCGINGANNKNCHFTFFATKELMKVHSKGVKDAELEQRTKGK